MNLKFYNNIQAAKEAFNKEFRKGDFVQIMDNDKDTCDFGFIVRMANASSGYLTIRFANVFKEYSSNCIKFNLSFDNSELRLNNKTVTKADFNDFIVPYRKLLEKYVNTKKEEIKKAKSRIIELRRLEKTARENYQEIISSMTDYLKVNK